MAIFTMKLRTIVEAYNNKSEPDLYENIDTLIRNAHSKIFDFEYPIFNDAYRETLESKIISHYYMHEIGLETPALFKHELKNMMRDIMPYYNQLYKSETIDFNPMHNMDFLNEVKSNSDGTSHGENTDHSKTNVENRQRTVGADTPQGHVPTLDVESFTHMSEVSVINGDGNNEINSNGDNDGEYHNEAEGTSKDTGKNSGESFSKMLEQYRETFINIDKMIIDELQVLFMGVNVWQN